MNLISILLCFMFSFSLFPGDTILDLRVETHFSKLPRNSLALSTLFPLGDLRIKHLDAQVVAFSACFVPQTGMNILGSTPWLLLKAK